MRKQKDDARQGLSEIAGGFKLLFGSAIAATKELCNVYIKGNKYEEEEEEEEEALSNAMQPAAVQYEDLDMITDEATLGDNEEVFDDTGYMASFADELEQEISQANESAEEIPAYAEKRTESDSFGTNFRGRGGEIDSLPEEYEEDEEVPHLKSEIMQELDKTAPSSPTLNRLKDRLNKRGD